MMLWAIILAAGLVTFSIRLSFILFFERWTFPDWFKRSLRFVPPAVLSAILVPELVNWNGVMDYSLDNPQILSGLLAVLVAWRTRSVLLSLGAGMAGFLTLLYIIN